MSKTTSIKTPAEVLEKIKEECPVGKVFWAWGDFIAFAAGQMGSIEHFETRQEFYPTWKDADFQWVLDEWRKWRG